MQDELQRMGRELDTLLQRAMAQWMETFDDLEEPRSQAHGRYIVYPQYVSLLAGARWNLVAAGEALQRQSQEDPVPDIPAASPATPSVCVPVEPDQLMEWMRTLSGGAFDGRSYRTGRDIPRNWSRPCCHSGDAAAGEQVVERVTEETWSEVIDKAGPEEVVVETAEVKETTYGKSKSGRKPRRRNDG